MRLVNKTLHSKSLILDIKDTHFTPTSAFPRIQYINKNLIDIPWAYLTDLDYQSREKLGFILNVTSAAGTGLLFAARYIMSGGKSNVSRQIFGLLE